MATLWHTIFYLSQQFALLFDSIIMLYYKTYAKDSEEKI